MNGFLSDEQRRTIAKNIKRCRQAKFPGRGGSTRCAKALGVSPQSYSPWERGKRTPDHKRLKEMAKIFGVAVGYFYRDHDKDEPNKTEPKGIIASVSLDLQTLTEDGMNNFDVHPETDHATVIQITRIAETVKRLMQPQLMNGTAVKIIVSNAALDADLSDFKHEPLPIELSAPETWEPGSGINSEKEELQSALVVGC